LVSGKTSGLLEHLFLRLGAAVQLMVGGSDCGKHLNVPS